MAIKGWDKFKKMFVINYDDYEEEYDEEYDSEVAIQDEIEPPKRTYSFKRNTEKAEPVEDRRPSFVSRQPRATRQSKVVPMRSNTAEVCIVKPINFTDAKEVIDYLLSGNAVILNLEGIKIDLGQSIIHMVAGGCYALDGNIKKISGYIYLVTPKNFVITGAMEDLFNDSSNMSNSFDKFKF